MPFSRIFALLPTHFSRVFALLPTHFLRVAALLLLIPIVTAASLFALAKSGRYDACGDEDAEIGDRLLACSHILANVSIPAEIRAEAYNNRGQAYASRNDHNSAIADYTRAIELAPRNAESFNLLAWTYFESGQAEKGLPNADKAVALDVKSANAYDTRAHIYEALGKKNEAISDYRKALSLVPELQESKLGLKRLGIQR
jgi:tetratricopeptide (TPR) repeat protein